MVNVSVRFHRMTRVTLKHTQPRRPVCHTHTLKDTRIKVPETQLLKRPGLFTDRVNKQKKDRNLTRGGVGSKGHQAVNMTDHRKYPLGVLLFLPN